LLREAAANRLSRKRWAAVLEGLIHYKDMRKDSTPCASMEEAEEANPKEISDE